ncbi:sulfotransferase [candidate division KSB1 bacterium]|nr:sulfotransferase [candidate division KSB1 bacterium]
MNSAFEFSMKAMEVGWKYVATTQKSRQSVDLFKDVQAYCMFLGYPRSGHSIIGALLDAHPNAVIAHEQAALQYVRAGFGRLRLYSLLLQNSISKATIGRRSGNYQYKVTGQSQGRFEAIHVIGDKQGEGATIRIKTWPTILERLQQKVQVPVKVIHVYRNPFDNITTMATRAAEAENNQSDLNLQIDKYFSLCETVMTVKKSYQQFEMIEIKQEEFIEDPSGTLSQLCKFLKLDPSDEYLKACAAIVYKNPHKSRKNVDWRLHLRQKVELRMTEFPYLKEYSFND